MGLFQHRKAVLAVTGVFWLGCLAGTASAAEDDQSRGADLVTALRDELKNKYSSLEYLNDRGRFRVTVTDTSDGIKRRVTAMFREREIASEPIIRRGKYNYRALERGVGRVSKVLKPAITSGNVKVAVNAPKNAIAVVVAEGSPKSVRKAIARARKAVRIPLVVETVAPDQVQVTPAA